MEIVHEQLTKPEGKKGWILEGFPRNVSQAGVLDGLLMGMDQETYNCVISFEVPENILIERLKKRAIQEGRTDDTPEVFRNRLSPPHPPKRLALLKAISLN